MLRHNFTVEFPLNLSLCLPCICDPVRFFEASPYTHEVKQLDKDTYLVVFKWRKLGMTRYFPVKFKVERARSGNTVRIVYRSTPDSKYYFLMEIEVRGEGPRRILVHVHTEMKAGLMADLLGRGEYRGFAEQLVRDGLFCAVEPPEEGQEEQSEATKAQRE